MNKLIYANYWFGCDWCFCEVGYICRLARQLSLICAVVTCGITVVVRRVTWDWKPGFNSSNSWWDGKLGIWPIGDWEPAKQKSKNRPKGTLVWKNKVVTKEVYQDLLISKLILSILEKWPRRDMLSRKIFIQQDGAKTTFVGMTSYSMMHW